MKSNNNFHLVVFIELVTVNTLKTVHVLVTYGLLVKSEDPLIENLVKLQHLKILDLMP